MLAAFGEMGGGHEFLFSDAADARRGEHLAFKKRFYSRLAALLLKGRELSDAGIACFASHAALWEKCVALNEPIVVLEDDVEPTSAAAFLSALERISASGLEYARLFSLSVRKTGARETAPGLIEFLGHPAGSQGYWIAPSAAEKFLRKLKPVFYSVDDYTDAFFVHGVANACVFPFVLKTNDEQANSVIAEAPDNKRRRNVLFKCTSEIFRAVQSARKRIFVFRHKRALSRRPEITPR